MTPRNRQELVEQYRDRVGRRSPGAAVRTRRQVMNFINRVGFCHLFRTTAQDIPSLWHAVHGVRDGEGARRDEAWHRASGFLWELRSTLVESEDICLGKFILQKPTLISREFLPYFFAVSGRTGERDEYVREAARGALSPVARRVMELFRRRTVLSSDRIREALRRSGIYGSAPAGAALLELQCKMYLARAPGGEGPGGHLAWSPVRVLFPREVRASRQIGEEHARRVILERHFRNQYIASVAGIRHVFRWSRQEIFQTLGDLLRRGMIAGNVRQEDSMAPTYIYLG